MSLNKLQTTVNSQNESKIIDESFFDNQAGYLMSEELSQGGNEAVVAFIDMCNHLENVFNFELDIIDVSLQTVCDLMMYLLDIPNKSIPEINLQLMELRKFLVWTMKNGIPTQDLSFPRVLAPEEIPPYRDSSE